MVKSIIKVIVLPLFPATSDVLAEAHHRPSDENATGAYIKLMTVTIAVPLWIMTEMASTLTTIAAALATTVGNRSRRRHLDGLCSSCKNRHCTRISAAVPVHNDT